MFQPGTSVWHSCFPTPRRVTTARGNYYMALNINSEKSPKNKIKKKTSAPNDPRVSRMGVGPVTDCCGLKFHWEAAEIVSRSLVQRKSVTLDTIWSALSWPKGHKSLLSILFIDIDILGCLRPVLFTCSNNRITGFSQSEEIQYKNTRERLVSRSKNPPPKTQNNKKPLKH